MTRTWWPVVCVLVALLCSGCGGSARSPMSSQRSADSETATSSRMPDSAAIEPVESSGEGETSRSISPRAGFKAQGADSSRSLGSAAPPEGDPSYQAEPTYSAAAPPDDAEYGLAPSVGMPAAPESSADTVAEAGAPLDHAVVKVFYGTDRRPRSQPLVTGHTYIERFLPLAFAAGITALALFFSPRLFQQRLSPTWTLIGVGSSILLGLSGLWSCWKLHLDYVHPRNDFGNGRGDLTVGVCDVTIPLSHDPGELESPSILRLEIRPDASKHIVLQSVTPLDANEFYAQMQYCVNTSTENDVLVFVHGFDNTYENAVRRTAQMAFDLKFTGAAVCYSWPSQGGLFKYFVDEANVESTIPNLQAFLRDIAARSDAKRIHLVAHSMGNRALTEALRALAQEYQQPVFSEVILTAPDVDATVFKRDIVPAIGRVSRRTTLYASSNDRALAVSRRIHGQPRAGDSGRALIVLPGLDTVDVSGVDTSLLGHSYYGSNESVLSDIYDLIHAGNPPSGRSWLQQAEREKMPYWVFGKTTTLARPAAPTTR